jgi:hypothetical protein
MNNSLLAGLFLLALSLNGQKMSAMFHYGDSLLREDPFEHIDTSSAITTGVLWDRIVSNIQLPAYSGSSEDTAPLTHDSRRAFYNTSG